jgi:hypothetical protein
MGPALRDAFKTELRRAAAAEAGGDSAQAFRHLERAHILSQRDTVAHVRSHLRMLAWGWRRRDLREVVGQATRIVAAALFSRVWVPVGNTGGARVSAVLPMPVPPDLAALLESDQALRRPPRS